MDDTDRALIALLRNDARASIASLAKALGVARGTVQNRMARLKSDGTIVFHFVDVTNRTPDQAMLVERRLRFASDGASFDDTEIYRSPDGTADSTTYHFTRPQPPM